jgi:hypothetical protein
MQAALLPAAISSVAAGSGFDHPEVHALVGARRAAVVRPPLGDRSPAVHLPCAVSSTPLPTVRGVNGRRRLTTAALSCLSLVLLACDDEGDDPDPTAAPATPGRDGNGAPVTFVGSGEVFVTGSSTVEPISVLVSELADELSGGELAVTVEGPAPATASPSSAPGTQTSPTRRAAIKDEEAATCAARHRVRRARDRDRRTDRRDESRQQPRRMPRRARALRARRARVGGVRRVERRSGVGCRARIDVVAPRRGSVHHRARTGERGRTTRSSSSRSPTSPRSGGTSRRHASTTRRAPTTT